MKMATITSHDACPPARFDLPPMRTTAETTHLFAFGTWDTSNVKFEMMSGSLAYMRFHSRLSNTLAHRTREHPVSWPSASGSSFATLPYWTVFGMLDFDLLAAHVAKAGASWASLSVEEDSDRHRQTASEAAQRISPRAGRRPVFF